MKRIDLYLTLLQIEALKRLSRKTGDSVGRIVRRALDDWLNQIADDYYRTRKEQEAEK